MASEAPAEAVSTMDINVLQLVVPSLRVWCLVSAIWVVHTRRSLGKQEKRNSAKEIGHRKTTNLFVALLYFTVKSTFVRVRLYCSA